MNMYAKPQFVKTTIVRNEAVEGETMELKVERILANKEPIKDGAPLIYTDKKDGVGAGFNIRTDRFEVALDGIDAIQKSNNAKRETKAEMTVVKNDKTDGGTEPTQGTKSE